MQFTPIRSDFFWIRYFIEPFDKYFLKGAINYFRCYQLSKKEGDIISHILETFVNLQTCDKNIGKINNNLMLQFNLRL